MRLSSRSWLGARRQSLASTHYVLLTTFRRDGDAVSSPVWAAEEAGALYVWTETASFKVRRIRRNPSVRLRACSFRGKPLGGERTGKASLLDASGTAHTRKLLARKYGLAGALAVKWPWPSYFTSSVALLRNILTNNRPDTIGIKSDLDPPEMTDR